MRTLTQRIKRVKVRKYSNWESKTLTSIQGKSHNYQSHNFWNMTVVWLKRKMVSAALFLLFRCERKQTLTCHLTIRQLLETEPNAPFSTTSPWTMQCGWWRRTYCKMTVPVCLHIHSSDSKEARMGYYVILETMLFFLICMLFLNVFSPNKMP